MVILIIGFQLLRLTLFNCIIITLYIVCVASAQGLAQRKTSSFGFLVLHSSFINT